MDDQRQDADRQATGEAVDVPEAARRLGVTPDAVRSRLHRGTLEGEKVDGAWRVILPPAESPTVDRQDATEGPTGQPTGNDPDRQDTDRTRQDAPTGDLAPMAQLIADLARRNEELSAAVGMWQARAHHLEEQVKQLSATAESTVEASGPSVDEVDDQDVSSASTEAEELPEGFISRFVRWWKGQ